MILGTGPIIVSALTVTVRDLGTDDSRRGPRSGWSVITVKPQASRSIPDFYVAGPWPCQIPMSTGQYIIGIQEYGRFNLKKRKSFGLHKRAFLKALDGIRQRATLSLS
jgi:hypothetical protein